MAEKKSYARNTAGLQAHAQQKAEEAKTRVMQTIDRLIKEKQPVNFNLVARTAGVTKSYLYTQSDLRTRIEGLRQQGASALKVVKGGPQEHPRSEKSKEVLLAAKERRIQELSEENKRLKAQLKLALGKQYEEI